MYDVCVRVLKWASAHADAEPGLAVLVSQLQALVARMTQVITEQRRGLVDARAATARKRELRRTILAMPIVHLAEIGKLAGREVHELAKAFRLRPTACTTEAFRSAVQVMYAEAQSHKEVLVKHGLSETVLAEFGQMLDEFDAAVQLGADGRMMHTAATRELETLTKEANRIVRAMDSQNRIRFRNDPAALEQWVSARRELGVPRPDSEEAPEVEGVAPGAGGDVRPAA